MMKKSTWLTIVGVLVASLVGIVGLGSAGASTTSGSTLTVGCTSTYRNTLINVQAKYDEFYPATDTFIEVYTPNVNTEIGGTLTVRASLPSVSFAEPPGSKWVVYLEAIQNQKLTIIKTVNYTNTCKLLK